MWKQFWRPETGIFLVMWLLLLVAGRKALLGDPGMFWHTVVGERIFATGFFDTDPFSFTFQGQTWIPHQWLGECSMAVLYRWGGWDTLLLATVTLLAGLYTWVAHRLMRAGLHWSSAALLAALTGAASCYHFHIRPHLLTILFLGWTFARLSDFEAGRIPLRKLFWLVPVFLLWTNLHGGLLGGLGTLGLVCFGWGVAWLCKFPSPIVNYKQVFALVGLGLACGLTILVNPYGVRMLGAWREIVSSPDLSMLILEHQPLDLLSKTTVGIPVVAVVYLATLLGTLPRRPQVTWLIPLVWLYLTMGKVRHGPLFCITAILAVAEMLPYSRVSAWLSQGSDLYQASGKVSPATTASLMVKPMLLPVLLVILALVLQGAAVPAPILGQGWAQLDPESWPLDLRPQLGTYASGTPIYNDLHLGGFLIFYTPNLRVYIDDRCELYKDAFLWQAITTEQLDPSQIERLARDYRFELVITQTGKPLDDYLQSQKDRWERCGEPTQAATLYRRRGS